MITIKVKKSKKIVFLIGLPGSGKTSIAKTIKKILLKNKITSLNIDGDEIRNILNNRNYSQKERNKLSLIYIKLAELFIKDVDFVIVSSVSLNRTIENYCRKRKNVIVFLIKKNFNLKDYKKDIIRKEFLKSKNLYIPKNINVIENKSILGSAKEILSLLN